MPEDIVTEIVEDAEMVFKPRPGGMVDTYRKNRAQREAADKEREQQNERVEEAGYKSVKVAQLKPEVLSTNVVTIVNGGTGMVLPNSPYRYRAVIQSSVPIILAKDSGQALGGVGFPLAANVPFTVETRAQVWAACLTGGPASVSVFSELYGPEDSK